MVEEASVINEYLPIRRSNLENDYITYLWNSFEHLASSDDPMASSFSVTAFHLLFMLSVQYKVLRIYRDMPEEYRRCFTIYKPRQSEKRLMSPHSVFDLSILRESDIFHLFELVGIDESCIGNCKQIVRKRNNEFMHASGNQPIDVETHVSNCLRQLAIIQAGFISSNNTLASKWSQELTPEDDEQEFVELRLFEEQLTGADFVSGDLNRLFGKALNL